MILYLAVIPDKYELPLGVYDTIKELTRQFDTRKVQKKKKAKIITINVNIEIEE